MPRVQRPTYSTFPLLRKLWRRELTPRPSATVAAFAAGGCAVGWFLKGVTQRAAHQCLGPLREGTSRSCGAHAGGDCAASRRGHYECVYAGDAGGGVPKRVS